MSSEPRPPRYQAAANPERRAKKQADSNDGHASGTPPNRQRTPIQRRTDKPAAGNAVNPRRIFKPRFASLAPNERVIDRRSDVGNPFIVGTPGVPDRETATARYRQALFAGTLRGYRSGRPITVEYLRGKYRGFDLVCSGCHEDGRPCHGDVILEVANRSLVR
jgi:hypothetical protein